MPFAGQGGKTSMAVHMEGEDEAAGAAWGDADDLVLDEDGFGGDTFGEGEDDIIKGDDGPGWDVGDDDLELPADLVSLFCYYFELNKKAD